MTNHYEAPHVNGVMTLTETEIADIKAKLEAIKTAYVPENPTEPQEMPLFNLVAEYNKANAGSEINGDTAEYVLNYGNESGV
jgi:ABC-type cobalamin/Fe3+-siderophores transport system ATPase subunit